MCYFKIYTYSYSIYSYMFNIFILKESSKLCLIFSYFSAVFVKWVSLPHQELSFNHILKGCLIPKDWEKKQAPFWSAFIWVVISKQCCNAGLGARQVQNNHFKKQDRNSTSLVALIFLPDLMFYYLILFLFYYLNFLIAFIN